MTILRTTIRYSVILACLVLGACGGPDQTTVWSTNVMSPGGEITAHAFAVKGGGFGGAYAFTAVELTDKSKSPSVRVVTFDNVCAFSERTGIVSLQWASNSHLIVTHTRCTETPELAAKALGVLITIVKK